MSQYTGHKKNDANRALTKPQRPHPDDYEKHGMYEKPTARSQYAKEKTTMVKTLGTKGQAGPNNSQEEKRKMTTDCMTVVG